ncbi:MAG TPA: hypothetical protein PKW35_17495 [Nannocystaceae bacterium]|nr:hypothetical protein [Nannocystaceae bacterium]
MSAPLALLLGGLALGAGGCLDPEPAGSASDSTSAASATAASDSTTGATRFPGGAYTVKAQDYAVQGGC